MVLRDPPGGMSYASYENVVTTTKVVTSALAVNGDADLSLTISAGASFDGDLCIGGGIGAIVLFCQGVSDVEFEGEIPLEAEINTDFLNNENEASNSYSTTWSYTTSDEPARAGAESDVFVMPNFSVMYEEVFIVAWDKDKCQPKLDPETDLFANTLIFDVDSDGNKPALSFYSRYHLDLVTIPDLEEQVQNQQNTLATMNDGEIICCPSRPGSCLGELDKGRSGRICVDTDFNTEEQKLKTLQTALNGWKKAISDEENAKKEAIRKKSPISDWFMHSNVGLVTDDEGTINDLAIAEGEHSAGLVPDELIPDAKRLDAAEELLGNKEGGDDISKTMSIQFAGDAGVYEMSLTKEASSAFTKQNCNWLSPASLGGTAGLVGAGLAFGPALPIVAGAMVITPAISGCNFDLALSAGIGGLEGDLEFPGVKIGLEAGLNLQIDIQHSSTITNEKCSESGITFGLGDPDDVGGRTKCRWEPGTAKGEDPKITVLNKPSQFIFPNEEMIFDVELANFGDHVYSYFLVGQDVDTETSALQMIFDNGNTLDYEGTSVKLNKEEPIPRKIRVVKGADSYDFKPVKLALRSACEFAMDYETLPIVEELFNFVEVDGTKKLKWLEPCPAVQFAGELKRDRSFLVNSQFLSDKDILSVTVFNPEAGKGVTFKDMKNGRLEKIQLLYREVGDVNWRNAKRINNNGNIVDIDFTKSREDEYGYVSMDWYIGGGTLPDGRYQIAVESQCTDVGGPDEFSFFRTDSIAGNIDLSPPEQFGYALPLNGRVFFGQEMKIIFTEPIDCAIPLSFDIEMTVFANGNQPQISLKKEDLLIICENRVLRFQVDYTRISPRILNGRRFRVEVGRIGGESLAYIADLNGNPIDHQTKGIIAFTKQFVDANLRRSLTEFHITKQDSSVSCQEDHKSEQIKTEITDLMESVDSDRLQISEVHCNESESFVTAKVQILPAPEGRRLRKGSALDNDEETPSDLMTKLSNSLPVYNDDSVRRLQKIDNNKVTYTMSQVNIIASEQDVAKYSETEEEKKEEERILDTALDSQYETTMGHTMVEMKQELAKEHEQIENLQSLQNELLKERKEMENERDQLLHEKQEEMDQFLKKKNAEFEQMEERLRKEKDEDIEQLVRKLGGVKSGFDLKQVLELQGVFLFVGCSIAGVVMFLQKKNNN
ncbi:hypothetical protein CTEN210_14198 [Chaetoceros tenuissimus]|uniref:Uncharacterized protein n=1 Tax=Chaetoceros tenuissimus TaxID=426638 RepID=A0AAD3HBI5_9STRA|nr:hypothetical protein CTEN210_14198 [Chaetoceros tenuissimus]